MPTNIELKAKLPRGMSLAMDIATELNGTQDPEVIAQHDTFFNAPNCRLKLRKEDGGRGSCLIAYDRADSTDAKRSDFEKTAVADASELEKVLSKALGVKGTVEKVRRLYFAEFKGLKARIHIDSVKELGDFIEFEVILEKESDVDVGNEFVKFLQKQLQIEDKDLLSGAYFDIDPDA